MPPSGRCPGWPLGGPPWTNWCCVTARTSAIPRSWPPRGADRAVLGGHQRPEPASPARGARGPAMQAWRRVAGLPDLLIAACAERAGLVLLHYDADFDAICAVTGQPGQWVVARGSEIGRAS